MHTKTEVNEFNETFKITATNGAFVSGHTSWGGEVFMVFVPIEDRGYGIAKALLRKAITLLAEMGCDSPGITSPISEEGVGMVKWFKKEIKTINQDRNINKLEL